MPKRSVTCCLLLLIVLACDGQVPDPSSSGSAPPSAPASPAAAVPTPIPLPSGPGPTDEPSGLASLLQPGDIRDMTAQEAEVIPDDPSPPFGQNGGVSAFTREWRGEKVIRTIVDLRWQFPDPESAAAFLQADDERLSERAAGLQPASEVEPLGPGSRLYRGTRQEGDEEFEVYNFLFTTGNFAGKVLLIGEPTLTRAIATEVARLAQQRVVNAIRGAAGEETVFPNAAELALLEHVPAQFRGSCTRPLAPELAGTQVAVDCLPGEGVDLVSYGQYVDRAAMDAAFRATADFFVVPEGGDCATDAKALHRYAIDGREVGRILCLTAANGRAVIHWTDERLDIRAVALRRDGDLRALHEFWSSGAGPFE